MGSSQNLYKFLKFDADNSTIRFVGLDGLFDNGVTITSGGQTITAGGQTITAGGQTVTAGDVKLVGGTLYAGQKIFVGGTTSTAPALFTGTVAPTTYYGKGSIYIDTQTASLYVQTATNAWKQFATPF